MPAIPSRRRLGPALLLVVVTLGAEAARASDDPPHPDEAWRGTPVGRIVAEGNHRTRAAIVVQEVLFGPGDPYDPDLARESERNLRALPFLGSARLTPRPNETGERVDVVVAVTERFPWVGGVLPSFGGGEIEIEAALGTGNLLGRGQLLGARAHVTTEGPDSYALVLSEPRLAGSRWGVAADLGVRGGVGPANRVRLARPLYSLQAKWSFDVQLFDEADERRLYSSGETVSRYERRRRGATAELRRAFPGDGRRVELRLALAHYDDEHERAPDGGTILPLDKRRATAAGEVRVERYSFVEERDFQRMGPVEDVRLGLWAGLRAGGALDVLGSDRSYPIVGADVGWFAGNPEDGYLRFDAIADGRIEEGRMTNLIARSSARGWRRTPARGLLGAFVELTLLDRMEDPTQLLLDSQNGVRGYPARTGDGSRRLAATLEWRRPVAQIGPVRTGAAVFVDAGAIWSETRRLADSPLLVGVGAGVRLGLARLIGAPVLRLDVGYGLRGGTWEVSGGLGQRF